VPVIMPKKNSTSIINLEFNEFFSNVSELQELLQAPRTRFRDENLPYTPLLQPVYVNPNHP
jgi:hypothetical protein